MCYVTRWLQMMNEKKWWRRRSWPILKDCPNIYPEGLRWTICVVSRLSVEPRISCMRSSSVNRCIIMFGVSKLVWRLFFSLNPNEETEVSFCKLFHRYLRSGLYWYLKNLGVMWNVRHQMGDMCRGPTNVRCTIQKLVTQICHPCKCINVVGPVWSLLMMALIRSAEEYKL